MPEFDRRELDNQVWATWESGMVSKRLRIAKIDE